MLKKFILNKLIRLYKIAASESQNRIYEQYRNKYSLDKTFRFNGVDILLYGDGQIHCGKGSYIGAYSSVLAYKNCTVIIGEGCSISHNVRLYTHTNEADQDFSVYPLIEKTGNITIGNFVWIGANVLINPGIAIGDNSVIGANSVVTRNIEPFSIVGGVPAVLIRKKNL